MFGAKVIEDATKHATDVFPNESCGFVVSSIYIPVSNIHEDPENFFKVSSKEYLLHETDEGIQGVIHSHPKGETIPSINDLRSQLDSDVPWCILPNGSIPFWFGAQVPIPPLEGRQFRYGVHDCIAIVRDWYKINKDVIIENIPTEYGWWDKGENVLIDNYKKWGFEKINPSVPLLPGDVLMGAVGSPVVNHVAIYNGDNTITHHFINRKSSKESYGTWKKALNIVLRYTKC